MMKKKNEKHLRRFPSTAGAGRVAEESASGETRFKTEGRKEERRKERERERSLWNWILDQAGSEDGNQAGT